MTSKQIVAVILLAVSIFVIYLGYEESKPTLGETIAEGSVDFLNTFANNANEKIDYNRSNRGIPFYLGGGLCGLVGVVILISESRNNPKTAS